jgi:hypothetical protein
MRLLNKEIDNRITVELDKSIKTDDISGIMKFGKNNDYPQIIEKLICGSQTAKAVSNIYAKFIEGDGFVNEAIGKEVVGKDNRGKPVTLNNIKRQIAESLAKFNGVFVHCNENLNMEVGNTSIVPFKYCRLSRKDDTGHCGKIAVHENWSKEKELKKFDKKDITWFFHFNLIPEVFSANVKDEGKNFKGQIYSYFLDDTYLYPLSPFDSVYLDMDTEYQVQLFKNREIRNGFTDKIIMNVDAPFDDTEREEQKEKIQSWMGADGEKVLIFESEFDEQGNLKDAAAFKVQEVKTNINDKLFESWEKSLSNNIRKAAKGLPAVLIDYEMGTLGAASGEMIIQAVEYYNAITKPLREIMAEIIKDIYSHHSSEILKNNTIWDLKDVSLLDKTNALNYVKPA